MKIISYSDLHLEFGSDFKPSSVDTADVMVLAGDIITFKDFEPLRQFLENWGKPVLYVPGNHEYYTRRPMDEERAKFREWLAATLPNVTLLQDEPVTIGGVHFFGGTMWTNFSDTNSGAMSAAAREMNDYRLIYTSQRVPLEPVDTIKFHDRFVQRLLEWFETELIGARVVISHHAPVVNQKTKYGNSPIMPAFNSLDMVGTIKKYQPDLWIYGHTHECDDQMVGKTRVISNQLGYPVRSGGYECDGFDGAGRIVEL